MPKKVQIKKPRPRKKLRIAIHRQYGTSAAFAYTLGVSQALVSQIINGYARVDEIRAEQFSSALGGTIKDFFPEVTI